LSAHSRGPTGLPYRRLRNRCPCRFDRASIPCTVMAATRPVPTAPFSEKTGRDWAGWLAFLDEIGARDMPHGEIAARVLATGDASAWWAQSITVAFEQHIGRRRPGQRSAGTYEVSANRTVA